MIEQLRRGEEIGLKVAFQRYSRLLRYFALQYVERSEVAEELVSDAFIAAWQRRTCFENEDKLRSFLYVAVKNGSLNHLRATRGKRITERIEEWEDLPCQDPDTLKKIIKAELVRSIYNGVFQLPDKQRKVFMLSFLEDLDATEVSRKLGMSLAAVYVNKSRALAAIRNLITP